MTEQKKCTFCGKIVADDAPGGLCLSCLLADQISKSSGPPGKQSAPEAKTVRIEMEPGEKAGDHIGRYKLLQRIGEGGMGSVWMAEQKEPIRRRVALKVIKLGMDTKTVVARFEAERQALALMDHPNIARVFDAGTTETGRPYFVMELVNGVHITQYCDENHLAARERLELFLAVCRAIQHAHQKGIIHRDIKPSNVMITLHDGVPVPKVIDFGIAKATQHELTEKTLFTQFGQIIGTPAYMSPEQAEMSGLDVDTRSDVYSLGVLLYELLVGKTPFDSKELLQAGLEAMRRTIREKEPMRPSTRLVKMTQQELTTTAKRRSAPAPKLIVLLAGDLDWIVMKTLEKDRTRRYDTVNGLAADVERHLNDQPIVARPPGRWYVLRKIVRRNKLAFAAASVAAIGLIAGVTMAGLGWRQALVKRDEAVLARSGEKRQRELAQASQAETQHELYVAKMNLVQQAWEKNNVERVLSLLEETAAWPERGFEWYYWKNRVHGELKTLVGQGGEIDSVAFSADGKYLLAGSKYTPAKLWDIETGQVLFTVGGPEGTRAVAFSPDGSRILIGDGRVGRVSEAANGTELLQLKGHEWAIWAVAFTPDGKRLLTGSDDRTAKVWDASSGELLLTLAEHTAPVKAVGCSPTGECYATGSEDGRVKTWDPSTGKSLATFAGHQRGVTCLAFRHDGSQLLTGSWDQSVKIWDILSGKEVQTISTGHSGGVRALAISPDGSRLVTAGMDQVAKVWDLTTGNELFSLKGHSAGIRAVAYSRDGRRIATGAGDSSSRKSQTVKIWDAVNRHDSIEFKGHTATVVAVAFSIDGRKLLTGSQDRTAKVWNAATGRELLTFRSHTAALQTVAICPDGKRAASGGEDQTAIIWDLATGKEILRLTGHTNSVSSVGFSATGNRLVTSSFDVTARVWDTTTGKETATLRGHSKGLFTARFSPDGRKVVTASYDLTSRVWDADTGEQLLLLPVGQGFTAEDASFSPDGRLIATAVDRVVKIWDVTKGVELRTLEGHGELVVSVDFSPDGRRLLTSSKDGSAKIWDVGVGRELLTLNGEMGAITGAIFSPDGRRIAIGGFPLARIWAAATDEQVSAWRAR